MNLSILCVTKYEEHAVGFVAEMERLGRELSAEVVIALDGVPLQPLFSGTVIQVRSNGYIESVLDEAIQACTGRYVLRLDDDERVSQKMEDWLRSGSYLTHEHWCFPRIHFWGDTQHYLPALWPDYQTRLSLKFMAGGRTRVHGPSPYGKGEKAPVMLEHWKFLVRSQEERQVIADRYEARLDGAGIGKFLPYNLPERITDLEVRAC